MWVQILDDNESPGVNRLGQVASIQPPFAGLDGTYPYSADTATVTYDSPYSPLPPSYGEVARVFDATMYLMWDPALPTGCTPATTSIDGNYTQSASTCTSTPIPLGSAQWKWSGCAINALIPQANGTTYFRSCGVDLVYAAQPAAEYPTWEVPVMPIGTLQ